MCDKIEIPIVWFSPPAIDSLKLIIKANNCTYIKKSLFQSLLVVNTDGEMIGDMIYVTEIIDENFKKNSLVYEKNGAKTTYKYVERHNFQTKEVEKFIFVLLNSKILGARYLEGITPDNIRVVYKELQDQNIIAFPFMTLLHSQWSDCDIKKDFICEEVDYEFLIKTWIRAFSDNHKFLMRDQGAKKFRENGLGVEFSKRVSNTYLKIPYVKIYDKKKEMTGAHKKSSKEFNDHYNILNADSPDLRRFEGQTKNIKHLRKMLNDENMSNDFESLLLCDKQKIVEYLEKKIIVNEVKIYKRVDTGEKRINDTIIEALMLVACDQYRAIHGSGYTDEECAGLMFEKYVREIYSDVTKNKRYRVKQKWCSCLPVQNKTIMAYQAYLSIAALLSPLPTYDVGSGSPKSDDLLKSEREKYKNDLEVFNLDPEKNMRDLQDLLNLKYKSNE